MLRNCEKMVLISSTPNEWPQPQHHHQQQQQQNIFIDDPKTTFNSVMDHPKSAVTAQDQQHQKQQQQQQQEALRCPRCDSTNTKFCYYNNYSLTQPRHFCKACKRYWTRGGTLRNVPVGGGCRKNKRVKRPTNSSITSSSCTSVEVNSGSGGGGGGLSSLSHGGVNNSSHIQDLINGSSAATNHHNHNNHPLFYGLPTNHSTNPDINFPFSRYDLQHPPQINGVGLGFSSTGLVQNMNTMNIHHNNHKPQIFRDLISQTTSNPTTTTTTAVSPSISSLLASMKGVHNNFQTLLPSYEDDLHLKSGVFAKDVKMEFENHRSDQNHWSSSNNNNHQMDQNMCSSSDPSSILWGNTAPNFSAWLDPSNNLGSSVPSLI